MQEILTEKGLKGARVGIELRNFGLTGDNHQFLRQSFTDWCELVDASHLVRELRVIKSEAVIAYVRQAAELANQSSEAMINATDPGVFEGRITATGIAPILEGGGDMPIRAGMILFLHAILIDGPRNLAMSAGYTILTRDDAQPPEVLSRLPLELINR